MKYSGIILGVGLFAIAVLYMGDRRDQYEPATKVSKPVSHESQEYREELQQDDTKEEVDETENSYASISGPVEVASQVVVKQSSTVPTTHSQEGWKHAIATVFWVGEDASDDNGYIANSESAFDERWKSHFGGEDDPDCREGYHPCAFTPKENPFYVALPYSDLDDEGDRKANAYMIPWNDPAADDTLIKNRWIEVRADGVSCFGQWEDVGPFHEDDVAYVFGDATEPLNTEGEGAGIDLSPAMRDCLRADGSSDVEWRHVESSDVPAGPWWSITTS